MIGGEKKRKEDNVRVENKKRKPSSRQADKKTVHDRLGTVTEASIEVVDLDDPDLEIQHEPVQSKNLDGSVNLSHKYKDPQLNQWLRKNEIDKPMFEEATGAEGELIFKCTVCDSQLYGVKNVQTHYNGKKHKKRLQDDEWNVFDPTVWEPRTVEPDLVETSQPEADKESNTSKSDTIQPIEVILA